MEKPIVSYIADLQEKTGLKDAEIAEKLGIKPSSMNHIKYGMTVPKDETCRRLAELAGDPPEKVLLLAAESRAPEALKPVWHNIIKKMAKSGLFTLMLLVFFNFSVFLAEIPNIHYATQKRAQSGAFKSRFVNVFREFALYQSKGFPSKILAGQGQAMYLNYSIMTFVSVFFK